MIDERTKQLITLFGIFNGKKYSSEQILNSDLIEYDAYRLYSFFSNADPNNGKGNSEIGKKDSIIAKYQSDILKSDKAKIFRVLEVGFSSQNEIKNRIEEIIKIFDSKDASKFAELPECPDFSCRDCDFCEEHKRKILL